MIYQTVKNLLTSGDLFAQLKINEIMKLEGSLIFYHAGIEIGLFKILVKPSSLEELAFKLNIKNTQLLSSLLDLGCSLNEVSCRSNKYRLKGSMAKALVSNIPIIELVKETVQYHADVAQRLNKFLINNEKGYYLNTFGGVIAESSRILEPMIKGFIYYTLKKTTPLKILEIGCGAGEYLKYYVDINKNNSGVAIDIDSSAIKIAQNKIKENSIDKSFVIMQDNIIKPEKIQNMTFDLATSFSNMHYFSDDDKIKIFERIYKLLNKNGRFILATGFKNKNLPSSYYDLIFSTTEGLYPLPVINDVVNYLKKTGFMRVKVVNLFGESFMGIIAYK